MARCPGWPRPTCRGPGVADAVSEHGPPAARLGAGAGPGAGRGPERDPRRGRGAPRPEAGESASAGRGRAPGDRFRHLPGGRGQRAHPYRAGGGAPPGSCRREQAEGREVGPPRRPDLQLLRRGAGVRRDGPGTVRLRVRRRPLAHRRGAQRASQLPSWCSAEVRSLAERCLAKDPALRPTAADLLAAAAYPAAGWLPAPVTRAMEAVPPVPGPSPTAGPGRPPRQTRRLGRWRPLTATLVLSALVGAGATAAVTMTAGSAPAHASQSAPRAAPAQTLAPASAPASSAPASPATAAPQTPPAATTPAYVQRAEHAARHRDPAADF